MHRGRKSTARFQRGHFLATLSICAVGVASLGGGCAAEVNTLEPLEEDAAAGQNSVDAPTNAGSKASNGGKTGSGGTMSGAAGTKMVNAFGGTTTSGGSAGTGSDAGNGGTVSSAGAGGAGGTKNGGAGGQLGTGGSAQAGTSSGGLAGAGGGLACLANWKGDVCDTCSKQTQSDKLGCVDILDCYVANACGPATCGGNTDKCGANKIGKGTAGYPIAQDVYGCLCK